ncbi:hypothetical protein EOA32_08590 [Mesorhizobium sp. M1A.F.Ca.ET.072.01.1.1]|uniref:hypothetical protein n=1 Tax=Mesorhizobium sp. M1A.F.Ca.ET.072.01.1.1 TaxID=2496753 RepID=UPI000FD36CCE|nr:hypothetical protein [Mesorhizobium sp. M1A.F.Ca.ET.072.01.1.1]RUW53631.1 hypothetical protein EOA32_08590 [Mesorhizobium sp. M1A.F.Ca.ET.072.01.1.1]TIV04391.1 MAG: hypothetical protein E5W04_03775 [Mesorhizobium sp.]
MAKLANAAEFEVVVQIPPRFDKYVDAAMLRIQSLYPACRLSRIDGAISIGSSGSVTEDHLRGTVLHALYREKIYAETLSMRQALFRAVTGR